MNKLQQYSEHLIRNVSMDFKRYLLPNINWNNRLFGIVGPRGIGKTTLILQHIKEMHSTLDAMYISLDNLYFTKYSLHETADKFYKYGGKTLFIDEIHKYPEWSRTLKHLYDNYPTLNIVFTGSSVLDILKGSADLSRRATTLHLQGLSFREYLQLYHGISLPILSLDQILKNEANDLKGRIGSPLKFFNEYLKNGYYPFTVGSDFKAHLQQVIIQTMESDIPMYANMNVSTGRRLLKLISIIADSVPFKPNFSQLAASIGASKNNIADYFHYIEKAGMIAQLREKGEGVLTVGRIEKVYLDNTNLSFCLSEKEPDVGNVRETFFYNQMRVNHTVFRSAQADFLIKDLTFEVGGKSKKQKQIQGLKKAYVVKDDIEYGHGNVLPLWAFGLNY